MKRDRTNNSERGVATVEFALTATFFFMMILVTVIGGHLFWMHNSLVEATRRGARYAANQAKPLTQSCINTSTTVNPVKNVVLYGTPTAGTTPIIPGLQPSNVTVCYSNDFGVAAGNVSVKIENYSYNFVVSGINSVIQLPPYQTTVRGENAGRIAGASCPP
ncbi:MAG TPA: TadE/TadG family type IV pilus assembly protein [Pyrinomonadaceae bacterium]|jgi:Flp pilus assembly protein TadG